GLLRPRRAELSALLRLGLPIGGTYAAEQGMFTFATLCMGALGSVQLAAHQIAIQAVTLAFILPQGLSYAVTYRVGQHLGGSRPRRAGLSALLRLGLPIGGTYAAEQGMFTFATLCMGALGSVQLAAHQIAIQAVTLAFILPQGLSYAVTYRVGQHLGGSRPAQVRRAGRLGIASGACCMLVFALLFWLLPGPVVGLFIDRTDPAFAEVVGLAISLLAVAAVFELFDGTQSIAMGTLRGLGDGKTTLLIGLGCYWLIGIPLAWTLAFPLGWGAHGVWWGLAAGLACAALVLTLSFEGKCARLLRRQPLTVPAGACLS